MHSMDCHPFQVHACLYVLSYQRLLDSVTSSVVTSPEFLEVIGLLAPKAFLPIGREFLAGWLLPQFLHLPRPLPPLWLESDWISVPCYHFVFGLPVRPVNLINVIVSGYSHFVERFCWVSLFDSTFDSFCYCQAFCKCTSSFHLIQECILDPWVLIVCKEQELDYFIGISEATVISNVFSFSIKSIWVLNELENCPPSWYQLWNKDCVGLK